MHFLKIVVKMQERPYTVLRLHHRLGGKNRRNICLSSHDEKGPEQTSYAGGVTARDMKLLKTSRHVYISSSS